MFIDTVRTGISSHIAYSIQQFIAVVWTGFSDKSWYWIGNKRWGISKLLASLFVCKVGIGCDTRPGIFMGNLAWTTMMRVNGYMKKNPPKPPPQKKKKKKKETHLEKDIEKNG
jgi:hypothetical protein